MGNSNSGLSITLDRAEGSKFEGYIAGSKISGTVYAESNEDANEVGLDLYFTGKEDVKVRYRKTIRSGDKTRTVTRYSYSKRDIVRLSIPLVEANSSINSGRYAYPFEMQLPDHLPSSMYHSAGGSYCNIVYKVKAEVGGKWRNVMAERQLVILAKPPSNAPVPNSVEPVTSKIMTCWCMSKGEITFAAHVDDTRIGQGEKMAVNFACKNESSSGIQFASAQIKQKIHWKSGSHNAGSQRVLASAYFRLDKGMEMSTKDEMKLMKDSDYGPGMISNAVGNDLFRELLATVQEGTNQVSLTIPSNACHTYNGQLMTVSHTLKIKVKTPFFSTDPETKVAIQLVTPDIFSQEGDDHALEHPNPSSSLLPDGWDASEVKTSAMTSGSGNVVYGGEISTGETEDEIAVSSFHTPRDLGGPSEPSLRVLLKELESSLSVKSTIQEKLQDSSWQIVVRDLQPQDVVAVVKAARMEFDQTEVAELIAPAVGNFTCDYIVVLIRSTADWLRIQFVQKLLPFCVDVKTNSDSILNELTHWEKISTERDFHKVLN